MMLALPSIHIIDSYCFRSSMNLLRDCNKEYVAPNGKIIAAKTQAELFCTCPKKCKKKYPDEKWLEIFDQFYRIGNQMDQNKFLQNHIVVKAVHTPKGSPTSPAKRRVTCKYQVPLLKDGESIEMFVDFPSSECIDVCQKAFMNIYGLTDKRIRKQREKCIEDIIPNYYGKKTGVNYSRFYKDNEEESSITSSSSNHDNDNNDQPLDLSISNHSEPSFQVNHLNLDEFASMLGVSTQWVDQKMIKKYEKMVEENLKKERGRMKKKNSPSKKTSSESTDHMEKEIDVIAGQNKANLPDFAKLLGVPNDLVNQELIDRYHKMVQDTINMEKRRKENPQLRIKALNSLLQHVPESTELSIVPTKVSDDDDDDGDEGELKSKHLKLDEYADMLQTSRNQEMLGRYEKMIKYTISNQANKQKTKPLSGLAQRLAGLTELSMIPAQILNNGNITITPITPQQEVEEEEEEEIEISRQQNDEIMQVDSFFQNQLWQPEYFDESTSTPNSP